MADVLMGVTETNSTAIDVISSRVQEYLQQESKMLPLVSNFSDLVVPGSKQVEIPKSGGFVVNSKSENVSVDAQSITYSTDAIALDQHRVIQWLIEDIASEQSAVRILEDALMKAGKDMARDIDQALINRLEAASASAPDHRVGYANNPTDTIQEADILNARKLLQQQYIDPMECFLGVSPSQEEAMLKLTNFIRADYYGGGQPLVSGEIGRVFGVRVIVHNDFEDLKSIMWHPTAAGFAQQFAPRFQSDLDLANLGRRYSLDCLYGTQTLDSGVRSVMIGTAA
jgi:N4-gp56 family major capsid protein